MASAKIVYLVEAIARMRRETPEIKAIVFSQWTSMLTLTAETLRQHVPGLGLAVLDGTMSSTTRAASVRAFREDPEVSVFLVSLKVGALGLNLTAGSRVYMLDLSWNPALEDQAFDRVHRIGQTRDVLIERLVIGDSVEERMLAVQSKKRELANSILAYDRVGRKSTTLSDDDLLHLFS